MPGSKRTPGGPGEWSHKHPLEEHPATTRSSLEREGSITGPGVCGKQLSGALACPKLSPEPQGLWVPLALLTPAPPCPTGPGSGNGVSAGASPGPCQPPCAQTKPPPSGLWGGGEWVRELTKRAGGAAPGARATPSPTCPERPHPLLPLGRSAGALGTVAMAAALGKLQLGNYCEHPSCLLPALESRGTSSQGQGSPSSHAGWPHPGLARCPPEVRRGGKHAGSKSRQASSSSRGPGDPQFPFYPPPLAHPWS